jgi:tetratricopeptide (TPR) repeat protein
MDYDKLTIEELTEKAEALEDSGMLDQALQFWRAAILREPEPVTLCQFGSLAARLEQWSEAENALVLAMSLSPLMPYASSLLGSLYFDQGRIEEAVVCFQKSLEIERRAPTLTELGVAQLELGLTMNARASFNEALAIDPNYEEAHYNLGLTYRNVEPSKALEFFQKAIEIDPDYAIAHRELGWTFRRLDKDVDAEYHLRRAIELNDDDGWAHIYLGNLLWVRGDLHSAEESFKKAIDVWSDYSMPYWCLAAFYEYQGRSEEAERLYQQGLVIDPNDPQANKLFGIYLKDIGQLAEARAYLERSLALRPEDKTISALLTTLS